MCAIELELPEKFSATTARADMLHAGNSTTYRYGISKVPIRYEILTLYPNMSCKAESYVEVEGIKEDVIFLRKLSKEAAKKEVLELIESEPGIGFYDISVKLRLELNFVVEVCKELIAEGKLSVKEPTRA